MKKQLLCTFTNKKFILTTLKSIIEAYVIMYNKIFIYENNDNKQQLLCVYNIDGLMRPKCYLPNTISVHRKKQTNTIYTINALNELIMEHNNGVIDTKFQIDWEQYRDYAFIIMKGKLNKIKINFYNTFFVKEKNENS